MPDFRFWGSRDPRGRSKPAIVAASPAAGSDAGASTLRLYDPIDSWGGDWGVSAREFIDALDQMPTGTHTINLHINSPGGEVYEAIAILNALRTHPARVVARVDGLAASAASFIASGADELVMSPNTDLMIHDAWGIVMGPAAAMRDVAERLDHISNNIASIYQTKAGGTVESWRSAMLAETWYSADEAVAAGLADSIGGAPVDEGAANAFDLSVFRNARRAAAAEPAPAAEPDPAPPAADDADSWRARHRHTAARLRHGLPA